MAYGAKYQIEFRDRRNFRWQAIIYKKDYASTTYDLKCTGTPLSIEMRGSGDVFDPIKIQEATLNVVLDGTMMGGDTDVNRLEEFKTAKIFDFYIKILRGVSAGSVPSVVHYQGTHITDIYTEPYNQIPYAIALKFTDLGDLAFIEFKDVSGFYKNIVPLSTIVYNCLKQLPFTYHLVEVLNLFPNEITDGDTKSTLGQVKVNVTGYVHYDYDKKRAVGDNCLEVLRKIMSSFGARLYQSHAELWYVVRLNEMTSPIDLPIKYNTLDKATSYGSNVSIGTITFNKVINNTEANGIAISSGAELSVETLVDILIYKYINQEPVRNGNDIIFNHKFDKGFYEVNATNKLANFWKLHSTLINGNLNVTATDDNAGIASTIGGYDIYNGTPILIDVNIPKQAFAFLEQAIEDGRTSAQGGTSGQTYLSYDKFYVSAFNPITDGNTYYSQEYLAVVTADKLRIKLKGRYLFRKTSSAPLNTFFTLYQRIYVAMKDLNSATTYYLKADKSGWQTTPCVATFQMGMQSGNFNIIYNYLHDNPFDFEIDVPSLPFNGVVDFVEVRVFVPLGSYFDNLNYRIDTATYEDISIQYITNNQVADVTIVQEHDLTVTPQKNVQRIIESFHGDGPFEYSLGALYSQPVTSYVLTGLWHRRDAVESISFAQTFVNTFFSIYSTYLRKITIDIYSFLETWQRLLLNDNVIYLLDAFVFDVKKSIYSTQIIEITKKEGAVIVVKSPIGIKAVPLLPSKGRIPHIKSKANGTISAATISGNIIGKTAISTNTDSIGNYAG